jgi:hypothetical protein
MLPIGSGMTARGRAGIRQGARPRPASTLKRTLSQATRRGGAQGDSAVTVRPEPCVIGRQRGTWYVGRYDGSAMTSANCSSGRTAWQSSATPTPLPSGPVGSLGIAPCNTRAVGSTSTWTRPTAASRARTAAARAAAGIAGRGATSARAAGGSPRSGVEDGEAVDVGVPAVVIPEQQEMSDVVSRSNSAVSAIAAHSSRALRGGMAPAPRVGGDEVVRLTGPPCARLIQGNRVGGRGPVLDDRVHDAP